MFEYVELQYVIDELQWLKSTALSLSKNELKLNTVQLNCSWEFWNEQFTEVERRVKSWIGFSSSPRS